MKSTASLPVSPSAGRNRVTEKTLASEVFDLWQAGDPDILHEADEFYRAWALSPEALKIAARLAAKK